MRLLVEHGGRDAQLEALAAFCETTLHAATAEQHGDAPLDTRAKALAVLELRTLLVCFALRRFGATTLRNANHLDAVLFARHHVSLTEEAAIRSIQIGGAADRLLVALEPRNHVLFVDVISIQNFILGDQTLRAFGEEYLVAELNGCLHLATLDEVRMGFENRVDPLQQGRTGCKRVQRWLGEAGASPTGSDQKSVHTEGNGKLRPLGIST
jgi:hypothetical protein